MAESESSRRVTPAARLTPEEVSTRGFSSAFRGVSESEVRGFLKRVADDLSYARARERQLIERVENLERQLREPVPLTEEQLLGALGDETARVLRSAQEAAEEIRARAQVRADLLIEQAEVEAGRVRGAAEGLQAEEIRLGKEKAAAILEHAETTSAQIRSQAETAAADLRHATETTAAQVRVAAETSSAEMLTRAETQVAELVARAEAVAAQLRISSETRAEEVRVAAETHAATIRAESEAFVAEERNRATGEAASEVDDARRQGREMVAEAKAVREKILGDLGRRRVALQAQVEELRTGRDRLLEAYKIVKDTLTDATEALNAVDVSVIAVPPPPLPAEIADLVAPEQATVPGGGQQADVYAAPPAAAVLPIADVPTRVDQKSEPVSAEERDDRPASHPRSDLEHSIAPYVVHAEVVDVVNSGQPERVDARQNGDEARDDILDEESETGDLVETVSTADNPVPSKSSTKRDVEELFAMIRSARDEAVEEARVALAEHASKSATQKSPPQQERTSPTPRPVGSPQAPPTASASSGGVALVLSEEPTQSEHKTRLSAVRESSDHALHAARAEGLAPIERDLMRQAKRKLQNEQNEVLDAIRTSRGTPTAATILPPMDTQIGSWAATIGPFVTAAFALGAPGLGPAPHQLQIQLAEHLVAPLRQRLTEAFDVRSQAMDDLLPVGDFDDLPQHIGARYREWRSEHLETAVADILVAAHARGVDSAAPEGSMLRWVTASDGCCPDCDDNALEPTPKGKRFPSGHTLPPSHAGCRCLVIAVGAPAKSSHLHAVGS